MIPLCIARNMAKTKKITKHKAFTFIQELGGISEYLHKKNGLRVLLWEDHSAPVVALNVTYLVGSRNEAVGHTGATHLLEHLMFKGSRKFNKKNGKGIWSYLGGTGAHMNATTWFDRTNYYELLPLAHIEKALDVESDRMRNSFILEADRKSEMTVVRNEFEWNENEPIEALHKQVWASAFQFHPYGTLTIGLKSDIENVSIERLQEFYKTFYWPNNAYVTLSGDITNKRALELVDKYFGKHKSAPHKIPIMYTQEPAQEGERHVTVRRAGEVGIVTIAHKVPNALDQDIFALDILAGVLCKGRSSRLYRALADKGLVSRASTSNNAFHDGGLFITDAFVAKNVTHERIEKIILDEYEKIISKGITDSELEREKYN